MKLRRFVTHASLKGGKIVLDNGRYVRGMLERYEDTDKLRLIIEKERGTRTKKQNAYYWSVVLELIGQHMGEHPEDLHEILKSRFLKRKRLWRGGDITILQSTTQLTTEEFGVYIDQCVQEGAELGVVVPPADKNYDLIETTSLQ